MIDCDGFATPSLTDAARMFRNCTALKTIYASPNFVVSAGMGSNMFKGCTTNLVGGGGTTWNSSYINESRAKIDNPPSDPGYFTAKP